MKFIEYLKESEENGPLTLLKAYVKNNKAKLSNLPCTIHASMGYPALQTRTFGEHFERK